MTTSEIPTITARPCSPETIYRGLRVASVGYIKHKSARVRARFAFPAVGLVIAGKGYFSIGDGMRSAICPGMLFGVFPGARFDYAPEPWWDEYYIGFTGPGAAELVEQGLIPRDGRPRHVANLPGTIARFERIIQTFHRACPGDADRAALLGQMLLLDMLTNSARKSARAADPIEAVLARLRARPGDAFDLIALAEQSNISYSLLRQNIRRRTGLPPAKYITRLRCEAACVRLASADASIQGVAAEVGIPDPYTFSRTFRRTMGMSPTRYRAMQHVYR